MANRCCVLLALALFASACAPSYVVVSVEDPDRDAALADRVAIGFAPNMPVDEHDLAGRVFPLTFAFAFRDAGDTELWARAFAGEAPVATASVALILDETTPATAMMQLRKHCTRDQECGWCQGGRCKQEICVAGAPPCIAPPFACLRVDCVNELLSCNIEPSLDLDDRDPCTLDQCGPSGEVLHDPVEDGAPCVGRTGTCSSGICS